jgi:hypothetical protein
VGNAYFVRASGGSDSNDGKTWAMAWASASKAAATAVSGDSVFFGPGTFANGSTQIYPTTGVWWFRAGIDVTILTWTGTIFADNPHCVFRANSRWQDLTLSCTESSNNATAGTASTQSNNDLSNLLLKRLKVVSARDCINIDNVFSNNIRIEDSFLYSTLDGLQLAGQNSGQGAEIVLLNTTITCINTASLHYAKCIICEPASSSVKFIVNCIDCKFIADTSGGPVQARAISINGANNEFDFIGGSVRSVGNSPLDFSVANSPIIRVSNTFIFDANKVGGATILYAPLQTL